MCTTHCNNGWKRRTVTQTQAQTQTQHQEITVVEMSLKIRYIWRDQPETTSKY